MRFFIFVKRYISNKNHRFLYLRSQGKSCFFDKIHDLNKKMIIKMSKKIRRNKKNE